jgi:hypothetical protein
MMILVFQDDGLMRVVDSVSEANREYEAIDVENGEYTFLDEHGCVLKPILRAPSKKRWPLFFTIYDTVPFTFEPTEEKREDLIARLRSGEIPLDPRSSKLRTLDELRREAPQLFSA